MVEHSSRGFPAVGVRIGWSRSFKVLSDVSSIWDYWTVKCSQISVGDGDNIFTSGGGTAYISVHITLCISFTLRQIEMPRRYRPKNKRKRAKCVPFFPRSCKFCKYWSTECLNVHKPQSMPYSDPHLGCQPSYSTKEQRSAWWRFRGSCDLIMISPCSGINLIDAATAMQPLHAASWYLNGCVFLYRCHPLVSIGLCHCRIPRPFSIRWVNPIFDNLFTSALPTGHNTGWIIMMMIYLRHPTK